MNEAQGAAATGEAEGTTSPTSAGSAAPQTGQESVKEQAPAPGQAVSNPTRLGALLEGMDLPPEVLASVMPKAEEEKKEEKPKEEQPAEQPAEEQPAEEQPAEEEPAPAAATPEAGDGEEEHVPEEWPQSAKARVQQEAEKRRKWRATAEQLNAQLQQARGQTQPVTVAAPTPQDPLVNVLDLATLAQVEAQWQEIADFTEDNPTGAYDVFLGTDAQGKEVRKDFSEDEIKDMRQKARPILRAVPKRREYLADLKNKAAEAQNSYAEMFKDGTQLNKDATDLLSSFPEIRRSPEWMLWLGDALTGRRIREAKNGSRPGGKQLSAEAQAILSAPKVKPAPAVIKARSHESGARKVSGDVDEKQARENFAQRNFSDEGLDDYVAALRRGQQAGQGPKQRALV